jgi:hypothetical protein
VKIDPAQVMQCLGVLPVSMSPGIFPYLGGSVDAHHLRAFVTDCGGAVVSGKRGAKLAATTPGVLVDPAAYSSYAKVDSAALFDYDEWLTRQLEAGVPLILTDTARIQNKDRSALQEALARWATIDEPTMVVLPIEPWWLREGLSWLTEDVRSAGRPVALVLLHRYNGLDAAGAVAGLLNFISDVGPLPVVLLRSDISAIGAVAHGAFASFLGWSANTRHGPLPMRQPSRDEDADDRDDSPSVLVPALHHYLKTSKLPALARNQRLDLLRCGDPVCRGSSLLKIAELSKVDLQAGRMLASQHNVASTEQLARRIFSDTEPRDAWWEACHSGANVGASLAAGGVSLPPSRWLHQWLELGSPSHDLHAVR